MRLKIFIALTLLTSLVTCAKKESERFSLIQGRKQHILDLGSGKPVVVFLTGRGSKLETFSIVQKEIAKTTQTFSYDRAGLGKSEQLDTVRTFDNMVKELNQLLENENVKPPYILVGHSLGGFLARYYYHIHSERVAGIVFIDPGHEDDVEVLLNARSGRERKTLDSLIHTINPKWPNGLKYEYKYSEDNFSLMKRIKPIADIPVTLFISTKLDEEEVGITRKDVDARIKLMTDWIGGIKETIFTEKSGHFVHKEEPELVAKEIEDLIDKIRASHK